MKNHSSWLYCPKGVDILYLKKPSCSSSELQVPTVLFVLVFHNIAPTVTVFDHKPQGVGSR